VTTLDQDLLKSWRLRLRANGLSPHTITHYLMAGRQLADWLEANDLPTEVTAIKRPALEGFQTWLTDPKPEGAGLKQGSMLTKHNALKQLWNFLLEEDEITASPMAKMKPPKAAEVAVAVFADGDIQAMIKTCNRKTFVDLRDAALLRVLADTGCRRSEVANMRLGDIDLETGTIDVMGKGSKPRTVVIGHETAAAIDRYQRARRTHKYARSDWLWLGLRGQMSGQAVYYRVRARAAMAGLDHAHTHQFRHTWASNMKSAGVQSDELMALAGWSTEAMLRKYGRATVKRRALLTGRKHSTMDRLAGR
jgi:site-specific recombinase XerD